MSVTLVLHHHYMFSQKFYFSREGYDYQLPKGNNIESFLASVKDLPITNLPSVFGLHPNAEIEYYSEAARSMWSDLLSLQSRKAPNLAGMSLEDCIASISKDISERVPIQNEDVGSFDLATVYQSIANTTSPTHIVLMQELKRWNKLCFCMISTLRDLQVSIYIYVWFCLSRVVLRSRSVQVKMCQPCTMTLSGALAHAADVPHTITCVVFVLSQLYYHHSYVAIQRPIPSYYLYCISISYMG